MEPYSKQLINRIVKEYENEHGDSKEYILDELSSWAIRKGLWEAPLKTKMQILSGELSRAMRGERKKVEGRKVRKYLSVKRKLESGKQQTLWSHFDVATPEFIEVSLAQRRSNLKNVAIQLHNDQWYCNKFNKTETPVQILFDFTDDLADYDHSIEEGQDPHDEDDELFDSED